MTFADAQPDPGTAREPKNSETKLAAKWSNLRHSQDELFQEVLAAERRAGQRGAAAERRMRAAEERAEASEQRVEDLLSANAELEEQNDELRAQNMDLEEKNDGLLAKIGEYEAQALERMLRVRHLEAENTRLEAAMAIHNQGDAERRPEYASRAKHPTPPQRGSARGLANQARASASSGPKPLRQRPRPEPPAEVESDDESTVRARSVLPRAAVAGGSKSNVASSSRASSRTAVGSTDEPPSKPVSAVTSASAAVSANSAKKCHWYLQFEEPPVTAELREGPIPFDFLAEQLILEDDAVETITRMRSEEGYQMRIYSAGDVAFLFKPIILQGPSGTYLIGWADKQYAQGLEMWAQEAKDLHMFFFPATKKESGWHYMGLHTVSFAPIVSIWGKLAAADKQHLLGELQERNPAMDVAAFKRDVRNGQLVQCCIQIESKHRREESLEFMRDYGLVGGDARAVAEEDW